MDEDSQEEKLRHCSFMRHRSPIFSKEEVKELLKLIENCKNILLDKSTCSAACHAKEGAWHNIAKAFNSKGFKHQRSVESLKMKWDNLKRIAKRFSKNVFDIAQDDFDDLSNRTVEILTEPENINNKLDNSLLPDELLNESDDQKLPHDWNNGEECHGNDDGGKKRSMNFSPHECNLLIRCVKQEKKCVLSNATTSEANRLKNKAWLRITNAYNKLSPQKRSTKVLRTKFTNMKRVASSLNLIKRLENRKRYKLIDDYDKDIKSEPMNEDNEHSEPEIDDNIHNDHSENNISNHNLSLLPDPLSPAFNDNPHIDLRNPIDNKEIVKLKMELLNYKMETAKLERKRIEEALRVQALENSLRLRTARLEAEAAAIKFPSGHPALAYTQDEELARKYLTLST